MRRGFGRTLKVFSIELRRRLTERLAGPVFFDYGNVSPNRSRKESGKPPCIRPQPSDAYFCT